MIQEELNRRTPCITTVQRAAQLKRMGVAVCGCVCLRSIWLRIYVSGIFLFSFFFLHLVHHQRQRWMLPDDSAYPGPKPHRHPMPASAAARSTTACSGKFRYPPRWSSIATTNHLVHVVTNSSNQHPPRLLHRCSLYGRMQSIYPSPQNGRARGCDTPAADTGTEPQLHRPPRRRRRDRLGGTR